MNPLPSTGLVNLVEEIQDEVASTNHLYTQNFESGLITHPIPFFGRLEEAQILTVGLNPSPREFDFSRWPSKAMSAAMLTERLHHYFHQPVAAPHPWFSKWNTVAKLLGEDIAYQTGKVAHLDLSPRSTIVASRTPSASLFNKMLSEDLKWLPALLDFAKRPASYRLREPPIAQRICPVFWKSMEPDMASTLRVSLFAANRD